VHFHTFFPKIHDSISKLNDFAERRCLSKFEGMFEILINNEKELLGKKT